MNMEESNNGSKKLQIRNSTAEFLIFQIENKEEGIEVLYQDETLWLTQKTMSILFDVDIRTINEHLKNIYSQGEVDKNTTIRKNRIVQKEGNRNISREVFIYSHFSRLSRQLRARHSISAMVYIYTSAVCHSWICH